MRITLKEKKKKQEPSGFKLKGRNGGIVDGFAICNPDGSFTFFQEIGYRAGSDQYETIEELLKLYSIKKKYYGPLEVKIET